jgi:hypothetical protein
MSLSKLLNQSLSIIKMGGTAVDEYGNAVPAQTSSISTVGYLEQHDSVETLNDRDTIVSTFKAYFPAGTNIAALDRVLFGSQTFEVDGEPWVVYNPRTRAVSHIDTKLKVVA